MENSSIGGSCMPNPIQLILNIIVMYSSFFNATSIVSDNSFTVAPSDRIILSNACRQNYSISVKRISWMSHCTRTFPFIPIFIFYSAGWAAAFLLEKHLFTQKNLDLECSYCQFDLYNGIWIELDTNCHYEWIALKFMAFFGFNIFFPIHSFWWRT